MIAFHSVHSWNIISWLTLLSLIFSLSLLTVKINTYSNRSCNGSTTEHTSKKSTENRTNNVRLIISNRWQCKPCLNCSQICEQKLTIMIVWHMEIATHLNCLLHVFNQIQYASFINSVQRLWWYHFLVALKQAFPCSPQLTGVVLHGPKSPLLAAIAVLPLIQTWGFNQQ